MAEAVALARQLGPLLRTRCHGLDLVQLKAQQVDLAPRPASSASRDSRSVSSSRTRAYAGDPVPELEGVTPAMCVEKVQLYR